MKIGLEAIAIDVPEHWVSLSELAEARGVDPGKYTLGLGQREMAVASPCEDSVVLAASAGRRLLENYQIDPASIALLVVGTETGVDHSKPVSSYVHQILGLSNFCRVLEIKHACYGAMAGISMAINYLQTGKSRGRKALVIATDIARYGKKTPGEPTQGAGAVALLLSDLSLDASGKENPSAEKSGLLEFDTENEGYYAKQVMDFWRPLYSKEAFADGHYSIQCYLDALEGSYGQFKKSFSLSLSENVTPFNERFAACLYHVPFVKMAQKAHQKLLEVDAGFCFEKGSPQQEMAQKDFVKRTSPSLVLNSKIGNIYSGALFLSLANFLGELAEQNVGKSVSLFSYGSGCGAEFMSGRVLEGAVDRMKLNSFSTLLEKRKKLSVEEYEAMLDACGQMDLNDEGVSDPARWKLQRPIVYLGTRNHRRVYTWDGNVIE